MSFIGAGVFLLSGIAKEFRNICKIPGILKGNLANIPVTSFFIFNGTTPSFFYLIEGTPVKSCFLNLLKYPLNLLKV